MTSSGSSWGVGSTCKACRGLERLFGLPGVESAVAGNVTALPNEAGDDGVVGEVGRKGGDTRGGNTGGGDGDGGSGGRGCSSEGDGMGSLGTTGSPGASSATTGGRAAPGGAAVGDRVAGGKSGAGDGRGGDRNDD